MLGEYDTDKDGFISLSEFIGDVRGDGKTIKSIPKHRKDCFSFPLLYLITRLHFSHFIIRGFPFPVGD